MFYSHLMAWSATTERKHSWLLQADGLHVHVYRQLKLTAKDHASLVAHREAWARGCRTLDKPFHAALDTLATLAQEEIVPAALFAHVHRLSSQGCTPQGPALIAELTQTGDRTGSTHVGQGVVDTRTGNAACGVAATAARETAGHASGSCQMLWNASGQNASPGVTGGRTAAHLLGASGTETAKAEVAFQGLLEAHDAHGRLRNDTMMRQLCPGRIMPPLKLARVMSAHVLVPREQRSQRPCPVDMIQLCNVACGQQWWCNVFAVPEVLLSELVGQQQHQ